jgi:acetoin utilization deacetylase AcuC-like enzyme
MTTALITHSAFINHDTGPGHPERADRMRAIDKVLTHELFNALDRREAPIRADAEDAILLAHPKSYLDAVKQARDQAQSDSLHLDADTVMSPGSWEAAIRAVGAGLDAVDLVMGEKREHRNVFCQVRPPGHHAEARRAMGFCIFASIAIAGLYARKKYGAERIAVVDFDVHHGNGTQDVFWSDKDLFFGSTHQMPLYPGTGSLSETGVGNIYNAPLRPGDGGAPFREAFLSRIIPALKNFHPDLVLISAGFDAHEDDPLANLRLKEPDFAWATQQLVDIAEKQADGRVVSMLEGGYNLRALAASVAVHVRALMST